MAIIDQRYASAVHSKSLSVDEKTTMSDTDVLGAMGLAARVLEDGRTWDGKPVRPAPLAVPLARLFAGDSNAAHEIVRTLATMAFDQSFAYGIKIAKPMCEDMAKSCLAWHRNGICRRCGGHGLSLIPGTKTLSDRASIARARARCPSNAISGRSGNRWPGGWLWRCGANPRELDLRRCVAWQQP
jgi:hypothetical protein